MFYNHDSLRNVVAKHLPGKNSVPILMLLLLIGLTGIYLFRPVYDPDFFWHLKTGQWIWQNKSLPHTDLFGVPPLPELSPRTDFIYTSYWLTQLILYTFYSCCGMQGIILFRWIMAVLSFLLCAYWTNVRSSMVAAVMAVGSIQLLEFYFVERPQFVSFAFFGALLVLLFRFLEQGSCWPLWRILAPISLLMLAWGNMHGGFLIGQGVLLFFLIAEGIKFSHRTLRPLSVRSYRMLLASSITALLVSFLHPNPINIIKILPFIFDADHYLHTTNLEEMSLWEYYRVNPDLTVIFYGVSIVLTFVALLVSKQQKNITWIGILVGTAFMGSQHMRLMPFFLVSALLFMTKFFATEYAGVKGRLVLMALLAANAIHGVRDELPRLIEALQSDFVSKYQFPVQSADYIANNNLTGNMYTTMYWGGYMIWRVGPGIRLFFDGRTLSARRAKEYVDSRIVGMNEPPYWKGLFTQYDIRLVVVPIYEENGDVNLLAESINADPNWAMVFANDAEVVFARKGPLQ